MPERRKPGQPPKPRKSVMKAFVATPAMDQQIKRYAARHDLSESYVIRKAVEAFMLLHDVKPTEKQYHAQPAADLIAA